MTIIFSSQCHVQSDNLNTSSNPSEGRTIASPNPSFSKDRQPNSNHSAASFQILFLGPTVAKHHQLTSRLQDHCPDSATNSSIPGMRARLRGVDGDVVDMVLRIWILSLLSKTGDQFNYMIILIHYSLYEIICIIACI